MLAIDMMRILSRQADIPVLIKSTRWQEPRRQEDDGHHHEHEPEQELQLHTFSPGQARAPLQSGYMLGASVWVRPLTKGDGLI